MMSRWSEFDAVRAFAGEKSRMAFASPPDEFRPVPWLCYTGKCSEAEVRQAIDAMYEQGIRSFFIFPIYGLEIEYLSDAWMDIVETTVAYCRDKGMTVWIYDDYNWPNGSCAGKLLEEYPEYSIQAARAELSDSVKPGETASIVLQGEPLRAFAIVADGGMTPVMVDFDAASQNASWVNALSGEARLLVVSRFRSACKWVANGGALWLKDKQPKTFFTDLLRQDASEVFVRMTYDAYKQRLKPYFGTTLLGFFDDEPSVFGYHLNDELSAAFAAKNGAALENALTDLIVFDAPERLRSRNDYWTLVGEKLGAHLKRIDAWCSAEGLDFTGHFLGEESPEQEVIGQGDVWPVRKNMSVPGSDLLGCQTNYGLTPSRALYSSAGSYASSGLVLTARVAAATARFNGSARVMCEAFGVMPYNVAPVDLMNHAHWLTAMGINLINDNLLTLSFEGFRKRAQGGRHFTTPWWKHYRDFAEAAGRCSVMAAMGRIPAKIGLLYPALTARALKSDRRWPFGKNPEDQRLLTRTNVFSQMTAEALVRGRWDWEIVFEELWENAEIDAGTARVGDLSLMTLIIPAAHVLARKVLEKLESFAAAGGRILFVGDAPSLAVEDDLDVPGRVAALTASGAVRVLAFAAETSWRSLRKAFRENLKEKPFADVEGVGADETLTVRRRGADRDVFHVVNMGDRETDLLATFDADKPLTLWRPDDGNVYALGDARFPNGEVRLRLAPREGIFLVASETTARETLRLDFPRKPSDFHAAYTDIGGRWGVDSLGLTPWEISRQAPNVARVTFWFRPDPEDRGVRENWREGLPDSAWRRAVGDQLPFELNPEECRWVWLKTTFVADIVPRDLAIVLDGRDYEEVYLNGERLGGLQSYTLWDPANIAYAIADKARVGRNLLAVRVRAGAYYASDVIIKNVFSGDVLEPVALIGDFSLKPDDDGQARLTPPRALATVGDWRDFGLANYIGDVTYRRSVTIDRVDREIWLDLGEVHCVAAARINGVELGRRCWPPYRFRVDRFSRRGENLLEIVVTNTLANLLTPAGWDRYTGTWERPIAAGLYGPVRFYARGER